MKGTLQTAISMGAYGCIWVHACMHGVCAPFALLAAGMQALAYSATFYLAESWPKSAWRAWLVAAQLWYKLACMQPRRITTEACKTPNHALNQ